MIAIKIENVSKKYRLGNIGSGILFKDLQSWWARTRGKEDPNSLLFQRYGANHQVNKHGEFWALRNLSLEIQAGDRVGIIGRNGAGKSTLLKILSRVTTPTSGEVKIRGRITSLLEVGTGFHPELTGRENIYLNGAILGMKRAEIKTKLDEIIAFAAVDQFVDTPVKRYSSGMYVRLAFSVAAHLDSEILAVDEVLAVGDAEFQKKCLGKMKDVSTNQGRTVFYVSHIMASVRQLCQSGILLQNGMLAISGDINTVIDKYQEIIGKGKDTAWESWNDAPGSAVCRIHKIEMTSGDRISETFSTEEEIQVRVWFWNASLGARLSIHIHLVDAFGNFVFTSSNNVTECVNVDPWDGKNFEVGTYLTICRIPSHLLSEGRFFVNVLLFRDNILIEASVYENASFFVQDTQDHIYKQTKFAGPIHPKLFWHTEKLSNKISD